jgi:hypothetical protein
MANKGGHRRFGSIRRLPSGRLQIRYPGPDGRMRTGQETYERISDAESARADRGPNDHGRVDRPGT